LGSLVKRANKKGERVRSGVTKIRSPILLSSGKGETGGKSKVVQTTRKDHKVSKQPLSVEGGQPNESDIVGLIGSKKLGCAATSQDKLQRTVLWGSTEGGEAIGEKGPPPRTQKRAPGRVYSQTAECCEKPPNKMAKVGIGGRELRNYCSPRSAKKKSQLNT